MINNQFRTFIRKSALYYQFAQEIPPSDFIFYQLFTCILLGSSELN